MKQNKILLELLIIGITSLLLLSPISSIGLPIKGKTTQNSILSTTTIQEPAPYKGVIRVFIVEPESRWIMDNGQNYHYGFLDFALTENISISYRESYQKQITWNPSVSGFEKNTIEENNIMVIAAIYPVDGVNKYAYPPFQNPFMAHYTDAVAGATPGQTGQNEKNETYTHTGIVEEATATWCPHCPAMANALFNIYTAKEMPFYFISLVTDENTIALEYLKEQYNLYAYPSAFIDGGKTVIVGGYDNEDYYRSRLSSSLTREVHDLDLSLHLDFNQDSTLSITVNLTNNEELTNTAPSAPEIDGETNGQSGESYQYKLSASDSERNNVYYRIDWGDGELTDWLGPHTHNQKLEINHTWSEKGDYVIRAQAKDSYGAESEWATVPIEMPFKKNLIQFKMFHAMLNHFNELLKKMQLQPDDNTPPNPPEITGPLTGEVNKPHRYVLLLTDPDEDQLVKLEVNFGDKTLYETCGCDKPWYNGTIIDISHVWKETGEYNITGRVMDEYGIWSEWSEPLSVSMPLQKENTIQHNEINTNEITKN